MPLNDCKSIRSVASLAREQIVRIFSILLFSSSAAHSGILDVDEWFTSGEFANRESEIARLLKAGNYIEAEVKALNVLSNTENSEGRRSIYYVQALLLVQKVYSKTARTEEAIRLLRDALHILESMKKPDDKGDVDQHNVRWLSGLVMTSLADLHYQKAQYAEAIPLLEKARLQPPSGRIGVGQFFASALTLNLRPKNQTKIARPADLILADAYIKVNRLDEAERILSLRTSDSTVEGLFALSGLMRIHLARQEKQKADDALSNALRISRTAMGFDREIDNLVAIELARELIKQDRYEEAAVLFTPSSLKYDASEIRKIRIGSEYTYDDLLETYLTIIANTKKSKRWTAAAFDAFERYHRSRLSATVSYAALSLAANNKENIEVGRQFQRLLSEAHEIEAQRRKLSVSRGDVKTLSELNERQANLAKYIAMVGARLIEQDPSYGRLLGTSSGEVGNLNRLIEPDEAIVEYFLGKSRSFALILKKDDAHLVPLKTTRDDVSRLVSMVRSTLVVGETIKRYDDKSAYILYKKIFQPLEQHLSSIRRIVVVSDGALQLMPFGALIDRSMTNADYQSYSWLINKYSFRYLPSATNFAHLRTLPSHFSGDNRLIGFGDPKFGNESGGIRNFRLTVEDLKASRRELVSLLRKQPELPETADELSELANLLNKDKSTVHLRGNATETMVKKSDFNNYDFVAFATHGVTSGQIGLIGEPALLLTPPDDEPTDLDDGLLTASEISTLSLNTKLAILSACNTAAGDGSGEGDALSGLAMSFFRAGARSVMVSHWAVESESAKRLTTGMIRSPDFEKNNWGDALRDSMVGLIKLGPEFSHPVFWSPFIIVGDR